MIFRGVGLLLLAAQIVAAPLLTGGAFALQDEPPPAPVRYLPRLQATSTIQPASELRALWVVRDALRSVETIDEMIDFAIQTRFHLIFVQVRGRGDAYYRSSVEPAAAGLELPLADFDPLEYLLIRARRAGISVHAWVNVFYVWSDPAAPPPPGHVVAEHPEWLLSSPDGQRQDRSGVRRWQQDGIEGYYLSPALPEVWAYNAKVVADLVSHYPLDGVHLDYVRYPGRGFTFGPEVRTRFALAWGVDPLEVTRSRGELTELLGDAAVAMMDSINVAWHVEHVDSAVAAIRRVTGGIALSAAVVADDVRGRVEKGQDWVGWLRSGLVDFVVPMAYADTPLEIAQRVRYYHNVIGRDRLLVGLALYDGRDEYLIDTIALIRGLGVTGYALFSYNVLAGNPFAARFIEETLFDTLPTVEGTTGDDEEWYDDAPPEDEEGGDRP